MKYAMVRTFDTIPIVCDMLWDFLCMTTSPWEQNVNNISLEKASCTVVYWNTHTYWGSFRCLKGMWASLSKALLIARVTCLYVCKCLFCLTCSMLQQSLFRLMIPLRSQYSQRSCFSVIYSLNSVPNLGILTKIHRCPHKARELTEDEALRCILSPLFPTACYLAKCSWSFLFSLSHSLWWCSFASGYVLKHRFNAVAVISSSPV